MWIGGSKAHNTRNFPHIPFSPLTTTHLSLPQVSKALSWAALTVLWGRWDPPALESWCLHLFSPQFKPPHPPTLPPAYLHTLPPPQPSPPPSLPPQPPTRLHLPSTLPTRLPPKMTRCFASGGVITAITSWGLSPPSWHRKSMLTSPSIARVSFGARSKGHLDKSSQFINLDRKNSFLLTLCLYHCINDFNIGCKSFPIISKLGDHSLIMHSPIDWCFGG